MAASARPASEPAAAVSREQVLAYRFSVQQLDRLASRTTTDAAILDIGVQDTGADGADWALANRGLVSKQAPNQRAELVLTWTLRGAPHVYRRAEIAAVAAATAPFSPADSAKRIFDAARQLRSAGISPEDALDTIAGHLREIVRRPMVKGEVSRQLTARLDAPYLRHCRPCNATHTYEQPFRLAALRAGLELQPGTSPPVLQRIRGWRGPAKRTPERLDVIRAYLQLLGPATPQQVAAYLDAPSADVKARWPQDATVVDVAGERRWCLNADLDILQGTNGLSGTIRLLGPHDLFLQARDRELLVPDPQLRKQLWPVLGRPGAVVAGGEVVGTWRPRASSGRLKLAVRLRSEVTSARLSEQAERLAAHRGLHFAGLSDAG